MQDKVILITGASSGIGAALAEQLCAKGAKLALAARSADKLQQVADRCPGAIAIPTDVTDPAASRRMVDLAVQHFGRLDVLVNNAGVSMFSPFEQIQDLAIFQKLIEVNYLGAVYTTYAALPHLKETSGLIVGVSSLAGKTGMPYRTGYSASKHAMQGFFDALRVELMDTGVDVSMISPGFVDTDIRQHSFGADGQLLGHDPHVGKKQMSPEECAAIIVKAIASRKREVLMGTKGKLLMLGKLLMPGLVDRMARQSAGWGKHER